LPREKTKKSRKDKKKKKGFTQRRGVAKKNKKEKKKKSYSKWLHLFIRVSFILERNVGNSFEEQIINHN